MKKCVNGEYIEMTAEEIAELYGDEETGPKNTTPTVEERLAALEARLAEKEGT